LHCTLLFVSWPIASPCLIVSFQVVPLLFRLALLLHLALLLPFMPCCFTLHYYFTLLRYLLQLFPPYCFTLLFCFALCPIACLVSTSTSPPFFDYKWKSLEHPLTFQLGKYCPFFYLFLLKKNFLMKNFLLFWFFFILVFFFQIFCFTFFLFLIFLFVCLCTIF
jgi:hypothetical protein